MAIMAIPYHIRMTLRVIKETTHHSRKRTDFGIHEQFRKVIEERIKTKPTLYGHDVLQWARSWDQTSARWVLYWWLSVWWRICLRSKTPESSFTKSRPEKISIRKIARQASEVSCQWHLWPWSCIVHILHRNSISNVQNNQHPNTVQTYHTV